MTTYAVTGATGHYGPIAVEQLLARGVVPGDIVAIARSPEKADALAGAGVEVRLGDYDRPETLAPALAGVDRLLLVSGSEVGSRVPQHTAVIEAAKAASVGHILYTSVLRADTTTLVIAPEHTATEKVIAASGIPHTFLRNGWYAENYAAAAPQHLARGVITHAAGDGRIAAATRADLAEAGAVALLSKEPREVYELAGPSFTYADLAATLTEITGTPVEARAVSAEQLTATLQEAGLDAGTAGFLTAVDTGIAQGELDGDTADLESLLARPATPLADVLRAALAA
ncbi:SDR family oxidoreductase [Georgenia halophila]|uniref:SDR family oxidoreductase n=1 Tax=Georgenia halophila TaxID=620889 RepID=A0ABP8LKX9_9MICO